MHCCAIKADFALCAVVVSKNKPNIVDPLPLMLAKKAPCLYNCDFISANSGNCVKILYSKSLNNKSFIFEQSSIRPFSPTIIVKHQQNLLQFWGNC